MVVLSLFDVTGHMVEPWLDAGHTCIIVDAQHPPGWREDGRLVRVGTMLWPFVCAEDQYAGPRPDIIFSFPPCTSLASSGSRWWSSKQKANPLFQDAAVSCMLIAERLGNHFNTPWMVENPVGAASRLWRKPDYWFHPWQYAGLHPEDNYTKKTGIWCGNGFRMPGHVPGEGKPDNRIHAAALGPERANFRSATPRGFARAVFEANRV